MRNNQAHMCYTGTVTKSAFVGQQHCFNYMYVNLLEAGITIVWNSKGTLPFRSPTLKLPDGRYDDRQYYIDQRRQEINAVQAFQDAKFMEENSVCA
jgi:hypothetical protein